MDLGTTYMGLQLRSPLIAGSSAMTSNIETLAEFEKSGTGAVVLKSLFEEQIRFETKMAYAGSSVDAYPEALDYIRNYSKEKSLETYLDLIRQAKKRLSIPVIASINCNTSAEWTEFAKQIESAGADALELNIFVLPSDPVKEGIQNEEIYFSIFHEVKKQVSLPIAIKISPYFSGLARFITKLAWSGPAGIVMFNRFFSPDFDLEHFSMVPAPVLSKPEDIYLSLRWVAMLSDRIACDIAASTGVHEGSGLIKQLLAGAKAVQATSVFYSKGPAHASRMLQELESWMQHHHFSCIEDFRGKMSYQKSENPAALERVQFMKYFAGIE